MHTNEEFIRDVQRFISVSAVGVSALRRQGKGVIPKIQTYLASINLSFFHSIKDHNEFKLWLNGQTEAIVSINHSPSIKWGAARKSLNLFLRDCLYNKYLSHKYNIGNAETFLEIPLDSIVAKKLKQDAGWGRLPAWDGLNNLKIVDSELFQQHASHMASQKEMPRVHLDVGLWVNNR